jgi:hypothetical protein
VRQQPYTKALLKLQGGKLDLPDRLFGSVQTAWELSNNNPNDVKELIPQFFYNPRFLLNADQLDLGITQDGHALNDVKLPPWAKDSADEFIRLHRQALESDYVSEHLHEWIDLIFGYKQQGKAAAEAGNLFHYTSYKEGRESALAAVTDPVARKALLDQIAFFGQTPMQLLTWPHPARNAEPPLKRLLSRGSSLLVRSPAPPTQTTPASTPRPSASNAAEGAIDEEEEEDDAATALPASGLTPFSRLKGLSSPRLSLGATMKKLFSNEQPQS